MSNLKQGMLSIYLEQFINSSEVVVKARKIDIEISFISMM